MPFQTDMFTVRIAGIQKTRRIQRFLSYCPQNSPLPSLGRPRLRPCTVRARCIAKTTFQHTTTAKTTRKTTIATTEDKDQNANFVSVKNLIRRLFGFNPKMCAIPNESDDEMYKKREAVTVSLFLFAVSVN